MKNKPTQTAQFKGQNIDLLTPIHTDLDYLERVSQNWEQVVGVKSQVELPEVLVVTSYPPRVCGIATYSQDLIATLNYKFGKSFAIKVCALESGKAKYEYPNEVNYVLTTSAQSEYIKLASDINQNDLIKVVLFQHEFGFYQKNAASFQKLIKDIKKSVILVFHTVIPKPTLELKENVIAMANACDYMVVMTKISAKVLMDDYGVDENKINVIAHGTHLVPHLSKKFLKEKYNLTDKKVLSTFGLLSAGKSIETTLDAMPAIVAKNPDVMFLVLGKTHPEVVKYEGEQYRKMLKNKVKELGIESHVRFVNSYLALPDLLEYLQLTDIYLFTTNDPNQAVSGTFAYAMSCACPIISTPIPHAKEVMTKNTGFIIDFKNSEQLAEAANRLLNDDLLRKNFSNNTLKRIVPTSWENSAVEHALLIKKVTHSTILPKYIWPPINLDHIQKMTTERGIIQFSKINHPDLKTGYTLDDNARALVALCMHFELTSEETDLPYIQTYLDFMQYCLQPQGDFLNYVDKNGKFTSQNQEENLQDAIGRAIWALGFLVSKKKILPISITEKAEKTITSSLTFVHTIHSPRSISFIIKGLYYYRSVHKVEENDLLVKVLADRIYKMYLHESSSSWKWYEDSMTYANSVLPEAMLCAGIITGEKNYKAVAIESLDFLISHIFNEQGIEVISNNNWLKKGEKAEKFGEQPIDVAYTIMALSTFYETYDNAEYLHKMTIAFNWFLGMNRLHQIIYNPCTGGCYDGLEEFNVNLNQGAESTVSYLMARLTMEKHRNIIYK